MFHFSCTSAEPPSRLQPQRIMSSHTQKPSNTLCWAYSEQVTLNVCLYVHSVAVYPLNVARILWLFGKRAHLSCVLQVMWHTSLQPVCWISRGPQRSWSWRVWSLLLRHTNLWRSTRAKESASVSNPPSDSWRPTLNGSIGERTFSLSWPPTLLSTIKSCTSWKLFTSETALNCAFRVLLVVAVALLVVWLVLDTRHRPQQLISFGGVCMFVVVIYLLSAHRAAVSFAMSHTMALLTAVAATVLKPHPRV